MKQRPKAFIIKHFGHYGPYLASGAIDFITGTCVVSSLQLAQSVIFPPAARVGKSGNDLAGGSAKGGGVSWRKRSLVLF